MQIDKYGNTTLVDRDTGKDHVCSAVVAREILAVATPAADGGPRYVDKDQWDGGAAGAAPSPPPAPPVVTPTPPAPPPPPPPLAPTQVEIPEDWATLHWSTRSKLAKLLGAPEPKNAAEADEVIAAELAKRAAA